MHKSGTKQATTWHTDLLLGTFTTRTDVTDWTVCRFFLYSIPLFFFSFIFSLSLKTKWRWNNTKKTQNIKFLVLSLASLLLFLKETAPKKIGSSIRVSLPPPLFLWWFWFHLTSSSNATCLSKWRHCRDMLYLTVPRNKTVGMLYQCCQFTSSGFEDKSGTLFIF